MYLYVSVLSLCLLPQSDIFETLMAWHSLGVLEVPLSTKEPTKKLSNGRTNEWMNQPTNQPTKEQERLGRALQQKTVNCCHDHADQNWLQIILGDVIHIHIHIKFKTRANDYIEQTKQTYICSSLRCTQGYLHNRLHVNNTIIMLLCLNSATVLDNTTLCKG